MFFCTADCGWITGHSYVTYGPLLNGATQVVFEGVPSYPTPSRMWEVVDKYSVSHLYTAPTAIRAFMGAGDDYVTATSRDSLRHRPVILIQQDASTCLDSSSSI